jgi:hypothetical protein
MWIDSTPILDGDCYLESLGLWWLQVDVPDDMLGRHHAVRRTLTLTGRGERMRASGPVERVVGQRPLRAVTASNVAAGEDA